MNLEQAIAAVEFWTHTDSMALGSTADPTIGAFLGGDEFDYERFSHPGQRKGWAIRVERYGTGNVENALYRMVLREIERRGQV